MSLEQRAGGILLPLFSLPGPADAGTLGRPARDFVDFLADAGMRWWQLLPINPIDFCHSPYSSSSTFAGESLYLDPEEFVTENLIPDDLLIPFRCGNGGDNTGGNIEIQNDSNGKKRDLDDGGRRHRVDYERARTVRHSIHRRAFENYHAGRGGEKYRVREEAFREENRFWLDDHLLFRVLADRFGTEAWNAWPEEFRRRDPVALTRVREECREEIAFHAFTQLVFDTQWRDFKAYAHDRGILLLGDVPIYVGMASVDTWANAPLFHIDADGHPYRTSGSPADSFNPDGQRWDSPLYHWDRMAETGYDWWLRRLDVTLTRFDAVRLDHFIGFYNYYSFPIRRRDRSLPVTENEPTDGLVPATPIDQDGGFWTAGPKEKFLDAVFERFDRTAFIAEDLGVMTPGVHALRDHYRLPGMEVAQFSYDWKHPGDSDPMTRCAEIAVACSGTHDTQTLAGWLTALKSPENQIPADYEFVARCFAEFLTEEERRNADGDRMTDRHRATDDDIRLLTRAGVRGVMNSKSRTALFPIQDFLGLGDQARMNFPGHAEGNWEWRLGSGDLTAERAVAIRNEMKQAGRFVE